LDFPAGALSQPTTITVARQSVAPEAGFWGNVVNLGLHAEPTAQTSDSLNAHAGSDTMTTLLEVLADQYRRVSHGLTLRSASRTGVVVP
jgi:hypothetical protein